ncbi:MAG: hypothetical protein AB1603_00350 [Chloroflexota bacterium]
MVPRSAHQDPNADQVVQLDAAGLHYRQLNELVRATVAGGMRKIKLLNVHGQRYIGTGLDLAVDIEVFGTPGNDLGAFMRGSRILVHGNVQDGCGNTMDDGYITVEGRAGDILGLAARGGKIFVRDNVGYRTGIHMKEYQEKCPIVVIGGTAQDFLGEYMAGGIIVLLGLNLDSGEFHQCRFVGTGMHGGAVYIRGQMRETQLGKEVGVQELSPEDKELLRGLIMEFSGHFGYNGDEILSGTFIKLIPRHLRPYGRLYAY